MSPEAQRIAIAEARGWTIMNPAYRHNRSNTGEEWWAVDPVGSPPKEWKPITCRAVTLRYEEVGFGSEGPVFVLPDYLNDLNAMHEAEEVLTSDQRASFERHLHKMCYPDYGKTWLSASPLSMFPLIHATAAQRAEAFCRTLWPEKFA